MATIRHPLTGTELNPIHIKRKALNGNTAVTAWVMKLQGESFTDITQKLGTNANRIGEVFREEEHPGSKSIAVELLRRNGDLMI
ncbi:MAG: hypothetical protein AAFY75_04150 [Pseudomonadota bacterium]